MRSTVNKRSVVLAGHKTSVTLEDPFWDALREIAQRRRMTLSGLIETIDHYRDHSNLSSAVRLFVLAAYRDRVSPTRNERVVNGAASLAQR
jgi:predicted DNA-binding ribbon-helix-helix protein